MVDTLYVATNAVPDTLKLALQSSNNSNYVFQFITLLIALAAIIIGPCVQLRIAKMNRKSDKEKIDNDLYKEIDLVWLKKFEKLITNYLEILKNLWIDIEDSKQIIKSKQILKPFLFNKIQLQLYLDYNNTLQNSLLDKIDYDLSDLLKLKTVEEQMNFIIKHINLVSITSNEIISEILKDNKKKI